jgi:hypothetical protein
MKFSHQLPLHVMCPFSCSLAAAAANSLQPALPPGEAPPRTRRAGHAISLHFSVSIAGFLNLEYIGYI